MISSSKLLRRCLLALLGTLSAASVAQSNPQFASPGVDYTGGRVTGFSYGQFQTLGIPGDILYVNAPTGAAPGSQVIAGQLLNNTHGSFTNLDLNRITFSQVSSVVSAVGAFDNDTLTDYAFALSPTIQGGNDFCIYYGTGATLSVNPSSSYSGGNVYPAAGNSGCMSFPVQGTKLPNFAYMLATPLTPAQHAQFILEDIANGYIYILSNDGVHGASGSLAPHVALVAFFAIPLADGPGPLFTGDFNRDNKTDLIVNGQNGLSASLYLGNGDGTFQPPIHILNQRIHSMLVQDMDGDGIPDLIVEGDRGIIQIFKGNGDGTFAQTGVVASPAGLEGFSGNGGHLAAITKLGSDQNFDILTTTPIGLSVFQGQGNLKFKLKGIYNVGPGRSTFALADFSNSGIPALAVDSPEGVARIPVNTDGSLGTSLAFAAGQPALGSTIASFTSSGNIDVAVVTGSSQAELLTGNGNGTFNAHRSTNGLPPPNQPLWANLFSRDFDGDGHQDLLYSITGLPLPVTGSGLIIQYGNGDGTFQSPQPISPQSLGAPANNTFYGESAVGDVNSDGLPDILNRDANYYDALLSKQGGGFTLGLNTPEGSNNNPDSFNHIATGYFQKANSTALDFIVQDGANIIPYLNADGDGIGFKAQPPLNKTPQNATQLFPGAILLADLDNTGIGDVIVPYHNLSADPANPNPAIQNQLYIWYGRGDGTFQDPISIALSRNYYLAAVGDMNGDGRPDIVLSDGYVVAILYNQGNHSFGAPQVNSGFKTGWLAGEQHFLVGQGINSLSIADVNGDNSPDLIVANGGATISNGVAIGGVTPNASGNLPSSISLTPNPDVNTGGITVLINTIQTKPVTGTLTSTPNPSKYQSPFTLTATITPSTGIPTVGGTVQFSVDGGAVGGAINVSNGPPYTASFAVPPGNSYGNGDHPISAVYSGDSQNSGLFIQGVKPQTVLGLQTTTTLALCIGGSSPNCPVIGTPTGLTPVTPLTMTYGQVFNGTETVTDTDGSAFTGTGFLNFLQNGVVICQLQASSGAQCPASVGTGTHGGTHVFTSTYTGDAAHQPSTSAPVIINVLADTNSATLTSSPNPSTVGQAVTFTAIFTGQYAPPNGPVTFLFGGVPLGTANLVPNGPQSLTSNAVFTTTSLPAGKDTVTASYAATPDFVAASASVVQTVIGLVGGTFTLSVTPAPVSVGVGLGTTVTVTVTPVSGFAQPVTLGCTNLPSGSACTFTTTTIPVGGGQTKLLITAMAPHGCGSAQPYFVGRNGSLPFAPALPALAGLAALFIPGRRRWLRALIALVAIAAATQIMGCGTCTDLGTMPASYTIHVVGTAGGSSEVESQAVTVKVTI